MYGYPVHRDKMKAILDDVFSGQGYTVEECEYIARDGFMPFIDGGFTVRKSFSISYLNGSGYSFGVRELDKEIETTIDNAYNYAVAEFKKAYPDYKGDISYGSLYENKEYALAEELDEYFDSYLDGLEVTLDLVVYYYEPNNWQSPKRGSEAIYTAIAYNFDEYGRNKYAKLINTKSVQAKNSAKTIRKQAEKLLALFKRIPE